MMKINQRYAAVTAISLMVCAPLVHSAANADGMIYEADQLQDIPCEKLKLETEGGKCYPLFKEQQTTIARWQRDGTHCDPGNPKHKVNVGGLFFQKNNTYYRIFGVQDVKYGLEFIFDADNLKKMDVRFLKLQPHGSSIWEARKKQNSLVTDRFEEYFKCWKIKDTNTLKWNGVSIREGELFLESDTVKGLFRRVVAKSTMIPPVISKEDQLLSDGVENWLNKEPIMDGKTSYEETFKERFNKMKSAYKNPEGRIPDEICPHCHETRAECEKTFHEKEALYRSRLVREMKFSCHNYWMETDGSRYQENINKYLKYLPTVHEKYYKHLSDLS